MFDFSTPGAKEKFRDLVLSTAEEHKAAGLTGDALREQSLRDGRTVVREWAKKDFWFFVAEVLGKKGFSRKFHGQLCDFMMRPDERKLVLAPRGHLKSTICTVYYALWRIVRNPEVRILIANYKLGNAESFLYQIRNEIVLNESFGAFFPDVIPDLKKVKWNDSQITVRRSSNPKEATVEVAGVGAEVTGRHYDLIICDDVVGPENITTKEQIEKVLQWFNQLEFLLDPGGEETVIGTRWHFDDLYGHIQANMADSFSVFKRGIYGKDGEPVWPERFTKERIAALRARVEKDPKGGPAVFVSQYLNEVMDESTATFKRQFLKRFRMEDLPDNLAVTMTVDPAISDKESADYTAITVRAVDDQGVWYVLESFARRGLSPMDLVERVFETYLKWKARGYEPDAVGIEYVAYQKALQFILFDEMRKRNLFLPMVELKNARSSKEFRIKGALATRWQMGLIRVPESWDDQTDELLDQLYRFPKCAHDDLPDSLAMHDEIPVAAPSPRKREENEEYHGNRKLDRYGYPADEEPSSYSGIFV